MRQQRDHHDGLQVDGLERSKVVVGLRQRLDVLRRRAPHEDRPLRLQGRSDQIRALSIHRDLLEHVAQPGHGRVTADDLQSTVHAILINQIDDAHIREVPNGDSRNPRERLIEVEGGRREQRPDFRQEPVLIFDSFLLRDVSKSDRQNSSAPDVQLRNGGIGWELLTVLANAEDLRASLSHSPRRLVPRGEAIHVQAVHLTEPIGDEHVERLSDDLRLRVAEDLLRTIAEQRDPLILVDADDRVGRDGEDACGSCLCEAKRFLGFLSGSDIELRPRHPDRLSPIVSGKDLASVEDPDPLT